MSERGSERPGEITALLQEWAAGDEAALGRLVDRVYGELRAIAARHFRRERREHTLQPTALVNELYLRLAGLEGTSWESRRQFFAMASRVMRRVLVDVARSRNRAKRKAVLVTLDEQAVAGDAVRVEDLDDALTAFEAVYPRECEVVELRYFGGLTEEEIAQTLGVSPRTVRRSWRFARHWLSDHLGRSGRRA